MKRKNMGSTLDSLLAETGDLPYVNARVTKEISGRGRTTAPIPRLTVSGRSTSRNKRKAMIRLHSWKGIKNAGMTSARIGRSDARVAREELSIRLRALREAAGMTETQLAKCARLTQSQLSRMEQHWMSEVRKNVIRKRKVGLTGFDKFFNKQMGDPKFAAEYRKARSKIFGLPTRAELRKLKRLVGRVAEGKEPLHALRPPASKRKKQS